MAPVSAGDEIIRLQGLADSNRNCLLSLIGVGVPGEIAAPKLASHLFLKRPNDQHVFVGRFCQCYVHLFYIGSASKQQDLYGSKAEG